MFILYKGKYITIEECKSILRGEEFVSEEDKKIDLIKASSDLNSAMQFELIQSLKGRLDGGGL